MGRVIFCIGEKINSHISLVGKYVRRDQLKDRDSNSRKLLMWTFSKSSEKTGFV
jgi:hypothetical protein